VSLTITPEWNNAGRQIPADFLGLSYETKMLLPTRAGQRFFRPDNTPLVSMFKSLGMRNLRIGGNSVDTPSVDVPSEADIDSLYAFAAAADVRVIYSVRMKAAVEPTDAARVAKYVMDHYADRTAAITVGNEPNMYFVDYAPYRNDYERFASAILAVAPNAIISGSSATPGKSPWTGELVRDVGGTPMLKLVTQHSYPGGNATKVTNAAHARRILLSPEIDAGYEAFYATFAPAAIEKHLPYRLEEANSFFHGGAPGVSNSFASALWALDYLYWWASHDAAGINFHTNNAIVADEQKIPGGYDTFWAGPNGFKVHPIGYGEKAFTLAAPGGRLVPVKIAGANGVNVVAYATLAADGTRYVTVINRESGEAGRAIAATTGMGDGASNAESLTLAAPNNDEAALTGVTLGGQMIGSAGNWNGRWTESTPDVLVMPTSCVVIRASSVQRR